MNLKIALAVAAALAAGPTLAAAPEKPAAKPARQCFWTHNVNGFAARDEHTVNIRVGVREVYQLEMFGPCLDVNWANRVAIRARGGGSHICEGIDAEIISPSTLGPQRCQVKAIRKLTPQEVAALPKGARP